MKNWSYTITEGEHAGKTLWSGRYCAVAAFVFLIDEGKVYILANKRGSGTPDYQGYWNCPCGFIEADESAEEACSREVLEETGYKIPANKFKLFGVETEPEKCNNGNITLRYRTIVEKDELENINTLSGEENEVDEIKWIPINEIDNYLWAFGHKERINELTGSYEVLYKRS